MFLKIMLKLIDAFTDGKITWEEMLEIINLIKQGDEKVK